MNFDRLCTSVCRISAGGGSIAHRPVEWIVTHGKDRRKHAIKPLDHCCSGAEITAQLQVPHAWKRQGATPGGEKKTYVGIAEPINRLHRITDTEEGPAVVRLPPGCQAIEQLDLADRGILKLIHENVVETVIQQQRQIFGRILIAERAASREGQTGVIDLTASFEQQVKLGCRPGQQT